MLQFFQLETTNCPLCGSGRHHGAYAWPATRYRVVRCEDCRFFFLNPRPAEATTRAMYRRDDYYRGDRDGYDDYRAQEKPLRRTFARLLGNLQRRGATGGRLLEVGCGYGYLLAEASPYFEKREGTDFSTAAVAEAAQRADAAIHGGLDDLPRDRTYDCIIANHVVEHVHDPRAFAAALAARLRPGGVMVLATPDMGAFWRRLMGRRWPSFKLPEHLLYFDRRTLSDLMAGAGLIDLRPIPYPHAFPLPLVAAKLGLRLPRSLDRCNLWLPKTTLALLGRKPTLDPPHSGNEGGEIPIELR